MNLYTNQTRNTVIKNTNSMIETTKIKQSQVSTSNFAQASISRGDVLTNNNNL